MSDHHAMEELTKHLTTKSDKIRRLNAAGYAKAAIAKFLDIRYQHVRNVLLDEERRHRSGLSEVRGPQVPSPPALAGTANPGKAIVRQDGSIVLPPSVLAVAGFKAGDTLFVRAEGEGEVDLLSSKAAIRRAQDLVRKFIGDDVSLVEELLKERRREVDNE